MHDPLVPQLSLIRQLKFCAGHRLLGHEGRCAFFHGHNYRVDLEVASRRGGVEVDAVGRIVDFSVIKQRMQGWLDANWDHAFLIHDRDANALAGLRLIEPVKYFLLPFNPTAENMARYLLETVASHVLADLGIVARRVGVWETDEACAVATRAEQDGLAVNPPAVAVVVDHRGSGTGRGV